VELFKTDYLQNAIVLKICKWDHQVEVECMGKIVTSLWKI
jgi:hypothetical protein